jgi:hypothetical protein
MDETSGQAHHQQRNWQAPRGDLVGKVGIAEAKEERLIAHDATDAEMSKRPLPRAAEGRRQMIAWAC